MRLKVGSRASMGPQLDSCGRRKSPHEPLPFFSASMGPQLDSCGRPLGVDECELCKAASMGPQLDSCGRGPCRGRLSVGPLKLQWGRNLTVAEGYIIVGDINSYGSLQWGRNLTVAEGRP